MLDQCSRTQLPFGAKGMEKLYRAQVAVAGPIITVGAVLGAFRVS